MPGPGWRRVAGPGRRRRATRWRRGDLARLPGLLLQVARREAGRTNRWLRLSGRDLDDLARQAAADALEGITVRLDAFRGQSAFSSWACKFAVSGVAAAGRRIWPTRALSLDLEDRDRLSFGQVNAQNGTSLSTRRCSKRAASCGPVWQLTEQILGAFQGCPWPGPPQLDDLLAAEPGDAGCGIAFHVLDRYAEADLNGTGRRKPVPGSGRICAAAKPAVRITWGCWPPWKGLPPGASAR